MDTRVDGPATRAMCEALDAADPLRDFRQRFASDGSGRIYFDANSVGAMPATVPERMAAFFEQQWMQARRQGWNGYPWLERPRQIGANFAHLLGAAPEDVIACDNTSVNLLKVLAAAWAARPHGRFRILTERSNFPTDIYIAEGLGRFIGEGFELVLADSREELLDRLDESVAAVSLSLVDYRSSERWDMARTSARAREVGALTVWDLSHAAGAVRVDLMGDGADFAVCCGYKYLCGGPGAPSLVWIHPRHQNASWPLIAGWMGHGDVFAFAERYQPATGIVRQLTGTPAVIADEVLHAASEIWRDVDPALMEVKHRSLGDLLIRLLDQECGAFGVELNSPREHARRGGHISFRHPGAGSIVEALLEAGVVGSFRKPDSIRFGIGALYLSHVEVWDAVQRLRAILAEERWRDPRFKKVSV